jgi:hypothetical protein
VAFPEVQPYNTLPQSLFWDLTFFAFPPKYQQRARIKLRLIKAPLLFAMAARFLQRIVKNDAMKQDPPEIYGWRVYALAVSVGRLLF